MTYTTSPLLADTSTTVREDLADTITMVDPVSFPYQSLFDTRTVYSTTFEWLVDFIPYVDETQASEEGEQASGSRTANSGSLASIFDAYPAVNESQYRRTRLANVTHILDKYVSISGTEMAVNEAGVGNEYAHQVFRIGTYLLMQQERNLHWSTYVDGSASPNNYKRQMHGLIPWILSTGLDNSSVTIAGKVVPNYFSSTVAYNPTWYPLEASTGGTDTLAPRATVTGPFRSYWNGTQMASYAASEVIPRLRLSGGAGSLAALDSGYFADASVTTADVLLGLNTGANYTDGDDTTGDFSVDLTRDLLNTYVLQPAYAKGMRIGGSLMLCSAAIKRLVGQFANVFGSGSPPALAMLNERWIAAAEKKLIDSVDYYESDFGIIGIHMDRYMESSTNYNPSGALLGFHDASYTNSETYYITPSKSFIIIEPDMVKIAVLNGRGFFHNPLGMQGDSLEGQLVSEMSIQPMNPRAFAGGFGFVATPGTLTT